MENYSISMNNKTDGSQSDTADYIQMPIFGLIILLTNFYTIIILSQKTFRNKKFNWLTMNICFASFTFSVIEIFSIVIRLIDVSKTMVSCRVLGFIIDQPVCYIMYSHCVTSFCRFLSIRYPRKLFFRSNYWLVGNIIFSIILSTILALPFLFTDGFACTSMNGNNSFIKFYSLLSTMFLPILIIILCNIAILCFVRKSTRRIQDLNQNAPHRLNKRDMYLYKIFMLTFFIFTLGWLPIFIEQMFFNGQSQLPTISTNVIQVLPAVSLLADTILIIYSDSSTRNLIVRTCQCRS